MKNNWLSENKEQINYYVSSKDIILIERSRQLKIFLELFDFNFQKKEGLHLLDLGCGDGILSKVILSKYPANNFTLLDGSATMLNKAKAEIKIESALFIHQTFDNLVAENKEEDKYDFIYSSMAIHHLEHAKKEALFSKIHALLKSNGLFINIDVVLPSSKTTEDFSFKLWTDWINEEIKNKNLDSEKNKHDDLPQIYKNKSENKPSTLASQLTMLEDIGFIDVECYFKYGIFVLFGGKKL
jgi:tRNA (cmo5U34)-methyltransferase